MSLPLDLTLLKDVTLLLISGIACLYCVLLHRRLKGLNDLKSGVGASIVSLTQAIKETQKAAKTAQSSTVGSIETLKDLLDKSNGASLRMESETIALQRNVKRAITVNAGLQVKVQTDLPDAIQRAQMTASNLLKVVADIEKYNATKTSNDKTAQDLKANITQISHLKVVDKPAEVLDTQKNESPSDQIENTQTGAVQSVELDNNGHMATELAQHFDEEASQQAGLDAPASKALQDDDMNAPKLIPPQDAETTDEALQSAPDTTLIEEVLETPLSTVEVIDSLEPLQENAPVLQRVPPLEVPAKVIDKPNLAKVTDLNAYEKQSDCKDPIDELFDNIDHLVKSKGVTKGMGFLKSREYYKS